MYKAEFNSELFREKYRTKSLRLPNYDYSSNGYYFVTICTKNRENYFGEIKNGIMGLNEIGCITHEQWIKTGELRSNVHLDTFVVMPNHIHGIIVIDNVFMSILFAMQNH